MAVRVKGTNLVYFPVPKVACTSVKLAIMRHNEPGRFIALRSDDHVHGKYGGYKSPPWNWEWRRYADPLMPSSWMRPFCVIRDPIDRFVSGYRNRVVHWNEFGGNPPDINEFALGLADYCKADRQIGHHFLPMTTYLGRDPSFYDRVFLMSELQALPVYCGFSAPLPKTQNDGPPISRTDLSKEALSRLEQFYAEDYRVWSGHLES